MPTLADYINAIDTATRGSVISPESHNSIRDAIVFLASQILPSSTTGAATLTLPPLFTRNDEGPDWRLTNGVASQDATGSSANGLFPITLPHGARILSLAVAGRRAGGVTTFNVRLVRVRIVDGDPTNVISANLSGAGDPFAITQGVSGGGDPSIAEGLSRVDTSAFTYLIIARVIGVQNIVQLNGITVSFDRS